MPPKVIAGRYRVEREVGRGGMGQVWLCRDELLGRLVAVKQVGHPPGESAPDLARAMREARSSAPLSHPNVVSIFDAIDEGERIWLVMEYVPGRTLAQLTAQEGRLTPERAARIGAQVADGLAAAHSRGTVHRDVKPGNILVTDDDVAKVSDFGIARTLGDQQLTQTGMMTGTPTYFSPELARGHDPTPASDVWALGASLYAAVEGRPPYLDKGNALAMLVQIAEESPRRPEHAGVLTEPLRRMLDPDPKSRWGMADVAHALHRIHDRSPRGTTTATAPLVDHTPTPEATPVPAPAPAAAPVTATRSPDRERRRGAGVLLLAALVLAALVVGGIALVASQDDEPTADAPSSTEPSGKDPKGTPSDTDPTTSEPTTADPTTADQTTAAPASSGGAAGFVTDYYAVLPSDTEAGWAQLTEAYQAETGGYDDYAGFWETIDSVSVDDTRSAGSRAVDVTLTYTTDGDSQTEVRRTYLEKSGDGYLISGSEIVG